MASEEDHTVYNEEDLDDDEDDDEEDYDLKPSHITPAPLTTTTMALNPSQDDVVVDDEDDDVDVDDDDVDDSTSSSNLATADPSLLLHHHHHHHLPPPPLPSPAPVVVVPGTGEVTVALPADHDPKRQLIDDVTVAAAAAAASVAVVEGKKPQVPLDESRRLFQRLWTDEDEIELLQGFLEYTSSRGAINSSHHHDTTAFYDQIKNKLQLDFNKNQLVEKLRRLKKKYRNVMNKIGLGKEYVFKSAHDQATFEISRKIWSGSGVGSGGCGAPVRSGVVAEEGGFDDEDANTNFSVHLIDQSPNPNPNGVDFNSFEKKTPRPRKRSRGGGVKVEEKQYGFNSIPNLQHKNQNHNVQSLTPPAAVVTPSPTATAAAIGTGSSSVTNLIEETVKSCLSPIFKELLNGVMNLNGPMGGSRGLGFGFALNPMPLGLNGDLLADEKWRKQQILELEVYSKRLELVQDQIKAQLEELRAMGG